jgi:crotonobetainyl-CoA:carnitine CoA-transferase CaiB-like acyl-CoA transferase
MERKPMTTPSDALADIWRTIGGEGAALARVSLTGAEPALPSSFRTGTIAQATIAASALAASEVDRVRNGRAQQVAVDMRHAAAEFISERLYTVDGKPPVWGWDRIAGTYQTGDGRWVRLHTNFPHHRDGILEMLGVAHEREQVAAALKGWRGQDYEDQVARRSLVGTMMRSPAEWGAHPQGMSIAGLPLLEIVKIAGAPPRPLPPGERPLSGMRVLDLTRVLAGPVCGRTLAAHGADVLRVTGPHLPDIPGLDVDTGRGKLSAHIDLRGDEGRAVLSDLLKSADIFVQGYRPGGIAERGFSPEQAARLRPGIVYVSLCAWSHVGPWAMRRGFDSLVQTATGINRAEADVAGVDRPVELPCQALDHGAGYLMAAGAMMALTRRAEIGGSWLVRVSLAQVGHWLTGLGRIPDGQKAAKIDRAAVDDLLIDLPSAFGTMSVLSHAGRLSATPPRWGRPPVALGAHAAAWPLA